MGRATRDLGLTGAVLAGSGLEFRVWRARHPVWGDEAVRLPALAVESNANDPRVDTGELFAAQGRLTWILFLAGAGKTIRANRGALEGDERADLVGDEAEQAGRDLEPVGLDAVSHGALLRPWRAPGHVAW